MAQPSCFLFGPRQTGKTTQLSMLAPPARARVNPALVPGAAADAAAALAAHPESRARFARVAPLVEGFESPFGLELLGTVHWVATRERPTSADELVARTYDWGERKRQFTPRQIGLAQRVLVDQGWIGSPGS